MKCIRCGAEISDDSQVCQACNLEFTEEMRKQMLDYQAKMEEYNRQMEEYNRQMEEYSRRQQAQSAQEQSPSEQQMPPVGQAQQFQQYAQPVATTSKVPNILAMLAALVSAMSVFLPYASGKVTGSIWEATSLPVALCFLLPVVVIVVLSFICTKPVKIINFIVCVLYSGLHIFEFALTYSNMKSEDFGSFSYGAYISVISAIFVFIAAPVWALIFRPKKVR